MLPTDYQTYYVYAHQDPITQEYVYIGKGRSCRAFRAMQLGHRSEAHAEWLDDQYHNGNIPVKFLWLHLSEEEAKDKEQEAIKKYKPKFNKHYNPDYDFRKFDPDIREFAKDLRKEFKYSYTQIAYLLGGESLVSRECKKAMSIWRMINE